MKTSQRIGFALLLGLTLFSGRSLLFRALRPPPASPAEHPRAHPVPIAPGPIYELARDLGEEATHAQGPTAAELGDASVSCRQLAEALEHNVTVDPIDLRAVVARAHVDLARAHLSRASGAYGKNAWPAAGIELRAAALEVEHAGVWGKPGGQLGETEEPLALAEHLSRGEAVSEQSFGGAVAGLDRAMKRLAPGPSHRIASAPG
jgi:hypothetical protein